MKDVKCKPTMYVTIFMISGICDTGDLNLCTVLGNTVCFCFAVKHKVTTVKPSFITGCNLKNELAKRSLPRNCLKHLYLCLRQSNLTTGSYLPLYLPCFLCRFNFTVFVCFSSRLNSKCPLTFSFWFIFLKVARKKCFFCASLTEFWPAGCCVSLRSAEKILLL